MPTRKNANKMTLGSILMNTPLQTIGSKLVYILLLVAFLVIGYLVGKVEALQKGSAQVAVAPAAAPAGQQPQAPVAPSPDEVLKKLTDGTFPVKGNKDAKVTVVEFADFRCPFCERFYTDTEPQLLKDYVDTGKVKFVFRNYAFLGAASTVAANAAECANEQGKFWEMYDYLYKNQPDESDTSMYTVDNLTSGAATAIGLNTDQFSSCLSANKYDKNQAADLAEGQSIGVSGTPTFYINGTQLVGAQPYASIKAVIDQELAKK
jgi:protein-disulfide isomerase